MLVLSLLSFLQSMLSFLQSMLSLSVGDFAVGVVRKIILYKQSKAATSIQRRECSIESNYNFNQIFSIEKCKNIIEQPVALRLLDRVKNKDVCMICARNGPVKLRGVSLTQRCRHIRRIRL